MDKSDIIITVDKYIMLVIYINIYRMELHVERKMRQKCARSIVPQILSDKLPILVISLYSECQRLLITWSIMHPTEYAT